jgi:hypothetical protein
VWTNKNIRIEALTEYESTFDEHANKQQPHA